MKVWDFFSFFRNYRVRKLFILRAEWMVIWAVIWWHFDSCLQLGSIILLWTLSLVFLVELPRRKSLSFLLNILIFHSRKQDKSKFQHTYLNHFQVFLQFDWILAEKVQNKFENCNFSSVLKKCISQVSNKMPKNSLKWKATVK